MELSASLLLFMLTMYVDLAYGSIAWSWLLGVPLASANLPVVHNESLQMQNDEFHEMHDNTEAVIKRRHGRHGERAYCKNDGHCGRRMFCDVHYNRCRRLSKDGEQCREDQQCHKHSECVFGVCRKTVKYGMTGAKCKSDADCDSNSCCARIHGELICNTRLPLGHKCFVPKGGLHYSINEVCPCQEGLYCTYHHSFKKTDISSDRSTSWALQRTTFEENTMRCSPFPVESFIKIA
ncbi:hypothetical protein CHUAL_001878 [Chamberlinius hualienensis]